MISCDFGASQVTENILLPRRLSELFVFRLFLYLFLFSLRRQQLLDTVCSMLLNFYH